MKSGSAFDENLGIHILKLVLSHLEQAKDLDSAAKTSPKFFLAANLVRVRRVRAQKMIAALVARQLDNVIQLLGKDQSLANTPFRFKANHYFGECPDILLTADMFACWLSDELMQTVLLESTKISQAEREKSFERLKERPIGGKDAFDSGSTYDFSELLRVTGEYVNDRSEGNWAQLMDALKKCPTYVLDAANWIYLKKINGPALEKINVWVAGGKWVTRVHMTAGITALMILDNVQQNPGVFQQILNRISSSRTQAPISTVVTIAV